MYKESEITAVGITVFLRNMIELIYRIVNSSADLFLHPVIPYIPDGLTS